jgi:transposase
MPKQIKIEILESENTLKNLLRKTSTDMYKARIKTLLMIKTDKVKYLTIIANKLGFTEKTIRTWLNLYTNEGLVNYMKVNFKSNVEKKISKELSDSIFAELNNKETTITSYVELLAIIEEKYNIVLPYTTLYSHCRRKYKSVLKVARKSHYKKDDKAVEAFKKLPKQN